ncbi:MAG: hypothetical protein AAGK25_12580, partial [Pseudomonadota bacterium]
TGAGVVIAVTEVTVAVIAVTVVIAAIAAIAATETRPRRAKEQTNGKTFFPSAQDLPVLWR